MDEPTDSPPQHQTADEPCPCGGSGHQPLRIGDQLSASGAVIGAVYVCPAQSTAGLRGVL